MIKSNIKYVNYNITRDDIIHQLEYEQHRLNMIAASIRKDMEHDLNSFKFRCKSDAFIVVFLVTAFIACNWHWPFLLLTLIHIVRFITSYTLYRDLKNIYLPSIDKDHNILPDNMEGVTTRELIDLFGYNNREHWVCYISAIYDRDISGIYLDDDGLLHIDYRDRESCVLKPTLVRDTDLDCITVTRGGIFVGNQTFVAKNSDMVTLLLD